ncbi:MAG: hypothetical protein H7326_09285 [Bdellovibrionaceae bacterium]|nr:hypothetical protein [Pseudobdellovibrionaceae bacterium]
MHFSCKITNSILTHLETQGEDLSVLYEHQTPLPIELMRDSSYWMSAPDMENFLESLLRLPLKSNDGNMLQRVGHEGPEIRAWGVLDSVLRMMPRPQEIFNQPERFLSHFISPEPPIENLKRDDGSISFDLPLPAEQYPLVTTYLKAAFESLPVYVGQNPATCEWSGIHLKLNWSESQASIFETDPGHQISPQLMETVIDELQKHQRELEERNCELQKKNEELLQAHMELQAHLRKEAPSLLPQVGLLSNLDFEAHQGPGYMVGQNLARLHDYMVRAQQLITMLASQGKMTPAVKEAMRRVDWEYVKTQYPKTISDSMDALRGLQNQFTLISTSKEEHPHV